MRRELKTLLSAAGGEESSLIGLPLSRSISGEELEIGPSPARGRYLRTEKRQGGQEEERNGRMTGLEEERSREGPRRKHGEK
jgi:hypothetical protein